MKLDHFLTPYTKISSKWIKDLSVRPDTIKLLEENIGITLYDVNHSNIFFNPSPRIMEIKANINKQDLFKPTRFCTAKETINKMKRQPTDWEKIFANDATDKGLVSKIYSLTLNSIKQTIHSDGRGEGCVLISCESTKISTSCQTTIERRTQEPTKKRYSMSKDKEEAAEKW